MPKAKVPFYSFFHVGILIGYENSTFRTLVFQVAAVFLLPIILQGTDGIWGSIVVAEGLAALLTAAFLIALKKKYHY